MTSCCDPTPGHVAIIGSGAAAFACALEVAERGARVTLIERGMIGGTCVNVGCVPSKILIRSAQLAHERRQTGFPALPPDAPIVDRPELAAQIAGRVEELRHAKYESLVAQEPLIQRISAEARFADSGTLILSGQNGEQVLTPDRILLATGARPRVPEIPGLAETPYWTSTEALASDQAPTHLVVIGGSVVAVELAQAFSRLGSQVTLLARSRLLSSETQALGDGLAACLADEGITVRTQTVPEQVTHDGSRFNLQLADEEVTADALLVATGRTPNTEALNLPAEIRTDARGAIVVDSAMRTGLPQVYAAGDCTTLPQFVYVAAAAGRRAGQAMFGESPSLDLDTLPSVIFTDPQVATVGLDVNGARARDINAESRRLPLDQVPRALANFDARGFVELIAEAGSGKLLGARILAPEAGEMIHIVTIVLRADQTVRDLADGLFAYLTWAEAIRLCAQTFEKDLKRLSCCAG